ncbi:hypothetical protein [Halorhabdus salina]|uniref:hypothetical protein n=1 Tax=Halorhabdus salina TaxID=2750670 RepID=UPI0015EF4483|nr:hypothetical protein [Halorhabdus salina]
MIRTDVRSPRPALQRLQLDQRALVDADLSDRFDVDLRRGFESRRDVIEWYQRAVVRTLGYIEDWIAPSQLVQDRSMLSNLIVSDRRSAWADDPVSLATAASVRRRLESNVVIPACSRAYNDLRKRAGEYIDSESEQTLEDIDPTEQENPAMRPGFAHVDAAQQQALSILWGGFENEDVLHDWLHWLDEPCNGAQDDDLAASIRRDRTAMRYLLTNDSERALARRYRERFAIVKLLPAFITGIHRMDTGELVTQSSSSLEVTPG